MSPVTLKAIGASVGALVLVVFLLAVVHSVQPYIVSAERYQIEDCAKNDPLASCEGERLTLYNPSYRIQDVTIGCAEDDEQIVRVWPRTRQTVEIQLTLPANFPACRILFSKGVR